MTYTDISDYTLFTLEEGAKILDCSTENIIDLIVQGLFKTARRDDEIYLLGFTLPCSRDIRFAINQPKPPTASPDLPEGSELPSFSLDSF